jgi:hypothetical protein
MNHTYTIKKKNEQRSKGTNSYPEKELALNKTIWNRPIMP